jgi:hypothetical protein
MILYTVYEVSLNILLLFWETSICLHDNNI